MAAKKMKGKKYVSYHHKKKKGTHGVKKLAQKARRLGKKYKVGKKIMKYGPGIAAAGLTAGGIAASLATGNPIPLMAGAAAGQGIKQLSQDMRSAHTRPAMVHRNHTSTDVAVSPTGSRTR